MTRWSRRCLVAACLPLCAAAAVLGSLTPTGAASAAAPAQSAFTKLAAVSASSATDAWAVGFRQQPAAHTLGLTRHWDGSGWTTVRSVHPMDYSFLWGVADISPTDAWAVGEKLGDAMILPYAEHWDGRRWTEVEIGNAPGIGTLTAVTANGPNDVWMVGERDDRNPFQYARAFVAHWNGHRLRTVHPAELTELRTVKLAGVSAVGTDDVWAVGARGRHGQTSLPLIERYDGSGWTVVPGDPAQGTVAELAGVAASSADDAWSVGWHVAPGDTTISADAQHWDGTRWSEVDIPSPGFAAYLSGVDMVAPNDVWAVGTWQKRLPFASSRPLVEHWDGSSWSVVSTPNQARTATYVAAVSMAGPDAGFAVGESATDGAAVGYSIRWDGANWTR